MLVCYAIIYIMKLLINLNFNLVIILINSLTQMSSNDQSTIFMFKKLTLTFKNQYLNT